MTSYYSNSMYASTQSNGNQQKMGQIMAAMMQGGVGDGNSFQDQ